VSLVQASIGVAPGRCGYGPRLPLLVISPYARRNFVDHTLTDQTSIARFIEDNWGLPRLGDGAMDQWAGSLVAMFNFGTPARTDLLILDLKQVSGQREFTFHLPRGALDVRADTAAARITTSRETSVLSMAGTLRCLVA
jgi:phospholipase C